MFLTLGDDVQTKMRLLTRQNGIRTPLCSIHIRIRYVFYNHYMLVSGNKLMIALQITIVLLGK